MPLKRFGEQSDFPPEGLLILENLGLTLYIAQLFERNLQIALTGLERLGAITIPDNVKRGNDGLINACLGPMLCLFEARSKMDPSMSSILKRAQHQRNFFAHRFLTENVIDMLNAAGRAAINNKLDNIYQNLQRADHIVSQLCDQIFAELGVSPEDVQARVSELTRMGESTDLENF